MHPARAGLLAELGAPRPVGVDGGESRERLGRTAPRAPARRPRPRSRSPARRRSARSARGEPACHPAAVGEVEAAGRGQQRARSRIARRRRPADDVHARLRARAGSAAPGGTRAGTACRCSRSSPAARSGPPSAAPECRPRRGSCVRLRRAARAPPRRRAGRGASRVKTSIAQSRESPVSAVNPCESATRSLPSTTAARAATPVAGVVGTKTRIGAAAISSARVPVSRSAITARPALRCRARSRACSRSVARRPPPVPRRRSRGARSRRGRGRTRRRARR